MLILLNVLLQIVLLSIHQAGKKLGYGELAQDACSIPVPKDVKLKDRKDFKIIGTAVKNVENRKYTHRQAIVRS